MRAQRVEGPALNLAMSDHTDEELATVRAIMERAIARRGAKANQAKQIELDRSHYREADSKD